jgi:hypothetical protein
MTITELLASFKERAERAHREICELAAFGGRERWRMSIPVDYQRDSDMVLQAPLDDISRLLKAVVRMENALERVHHAVANACEWHGADPHDSELDSCGQVENWHEGAFEEMRTARADVIKILGGVEGK